MMINLIGCRGGDPDAPRLLKAEGWHYGFRSDYTPYGWPYFIDIDWLKYDWPNHIRVIKEWKPVQAMVADYTKQDQRRMMLSQVADVRDCNVRPMVCPKFAGAVADIPADCIVAVSVPTGYAGYLPDAKELTGRDVHFLGGHPDQLAVLMHRYSQARVVSIDCSTIFQKAQFGAFWSAHHNTWRYVKHRFSTHALMRMSARKVREYLSHPPIFRKERRRLGAVGFRIQPYLFEERE